MSDTEATLLDSIARLNKPDTVSLCKWVKNRSVLNYTALAAALHMRDEPSQPTVATKHIDYVLRSYRQRHRRANTDTHVFPLLPIQPSFQI